MADILTMGVDLGSTTSKCVILRNGADTLSSAIAQAGAGTGGPARAVAEALDKAGLTRPEITAVTATGYGRNTFAGADFVVSELSCHAAGAHAVFPEARTVIDIGGQDAKVLRTGPSGTLENFIMNDKCAAGTGRFLDVMARVLELDVSELAQYDARAESAVTISSTCTVFAESEVISQLAGGVDLCALIAGIHASVAVRTASLVKRLGLVPPLAMTGGVAQNAGVVRALEKELGQPISVSPIAQLNGAYGAALYAWKKLGKDD